MSKAKSEMQIPIGSLPKSSQPRLLFADNLRALMIALVLIVHMAITYGSPFGSWYYQEALVGIPSSVVYGVLQGIIQAFFMGLLFFLSGFFTPPSYDRKGGRQFLKDRLIRLGIPLLAFVVLVEPAVDYVVALTNGSFQGSFLAYYGKYVFFGFGLLWFVLALLAFAVGYRVWRVIKPSPTRARPFPRNGVILAFALLLGAISFAVRLVFPMGYFSPLFSFQYAFFTQYIALFIVGLIAYRGNWLRTIPKKTGSLWTKITLALLVLALPAFYIPALITGDLTSVFGGFSWQAAAYAFWEQLFGIAIMISLIFWFREKVNFQNRIMKALSDSSYTAYIIQVPVLVFLALGLQSIQLPLLLKFAVVSPIGVVLCFAVAYLVRKIPKVDKVL